MLWTIVVLILIFWALGQFASFSPVRGNNWVHVLLVIVVVIIAYQLLAGGGLRLHRL
jgi:CDP-diglyceride synthetase